MALPDVPGYLHQHGEERVLARKLARLVDWLDGNLAEMPVQVEQRPHGHCAWVFDVIGYRVDRQARSVMTFTRVGGARIPHPKVEVEVFKPLRTREWIRPLLAHTAIADPWWQGHLFVNAQERKRQEAWLAESAWQQVRGDPRFRRLRRQLLPDALGLDKELMSLALRSRPFPYHQGVSNSLYTRVWQHEDAYRRVARENPRLLPLVSLAIREKKLHSGEDPVAGVRRMFLEKGVSPAGWRYVAHHGSRLFTLMWARMLCGAPLPAAISLVKRLEAAGLPPPPTPAVLDYVELYTRLPGSLIGLAVRASREALARGRYQAFLDEISTVMHWAFEENPVLDKRQRYAGWPWAVRRAAEWKHRKELLKAARPQSWASVIGEFSSPPYRIVPLDSVALMIEEGLAMRNCLADCVGSCQVGLSRFFSVRHPVSGKRVAVFEIRTNQDGSHWVLNEVLGPRNSVANASIREKAHAVAALYDTLDQEPRPLPIARLPSCIDETDGRPGEVLWTCYPR